MFNTIDRVKQLAEERDLSIFGICKLTKLSYSTFKNTEIRGGQLSIDSIETLCSGLGITIAQFFTAPQYKSRRNNH